MRKENPEKSTKRNNPFQILEEDNSGEENIREEDLVKQHKYKGKEIGSEEEQ